jgi:hypothetical protein
MGDFVKHNARLSIWLILLFATLLWAGCSKDTPRNPALILLSGAKDIRQAQSKGTEQLGYTLKEAYPADAALKDIKARLEKAGWKPMKEAFLNPGSPSSHSRGWTDYVDATRQPNQNVKQWAAQWENDKGDVVEYFLVYRSPINEPQQLDSLQVMEVYLPAKVAEATRKFALKEMQKSGKQVPAKP